MIRLTSCPKCGGRLTVDTEELACRACGRRFHVKHPHGSGSWGPKYLKTRKLCPCGRLIPGPSQRPASQVPSVSAGALGGEGAREAGLEWEDVRRGQTAIPITSPSPQCDDCRLKHYRATRPDAPKRDGHGLEHLSDEEIRTRCKQQ